MTRSEAYAEGWAVGARWAEGDISSKVRRDPERTKSAATDSLRAYCYGVERGYRDTWARWNSGALTWEMLEHAPVGR